MVSPSAMISPVFVLDLIFWDVVVAEEVNDLDAKNGREPEHYAPR